MNLQNDKVKRHSIGCLYHVTDESNVTSIIDNACISSWADIKARGIDVPHAGGNAITRTLDKRVGLDSFVHLYMKKPDEALLNRLKNSGSVINPVVLEITPDIINESTLFSTGDPYKNEFCELEDILSMEEIPPEACAFIRSLISFRYIRNTPEGYRAKVSSQHPTAIVFIIDHSSSMGRSATFGGKNYDYMSDVVASSVNREIEALLSSCQEEDGSISDRFNIAALGYGSDAYSAWCGKLKGRGFVSMSELAQRRGSDAEFPWIEPREDGGGSHCEKAFREAYNLLEEWMANQKSPFYFPPIVVHITDGDVSSDARKEFMLFAEKIKRLKTADGNVILWNLNVTPFSHSEMLLPSGADISALVNTGLALYEASSILPEVYRKKIVAITGDDDELQHRAMGVNVSLENMARLIELSMTSLRK